MTKTTKKGFTIIELLIVIVVIGILAAIVTVTYQGVQNRARTTSAAQNAREVAKKAEAYNASMSKFPADILELFKDDVSGFPSEAKLGESVKKIYAGKQDQEIKDGKPSANTKEYLAYRVCKKGDDQVGAIVYYWDYEKSKIATGDNTEKPITVGLTDSTTDVTCDDKLTNS